MRPVSRERLLAIERAAVAAWPAGETADIGGWLWRSSGGGWCCSSSMVSPPLHMVSLRLSLIRNYMRKCQLP